MELLYYSIYYFSFVFLVHVSCTAIAGASDIFKIKIRSSL